MTRSNCIDNSSYGEQSYGLGKLDIGNFASSVPHVTVEVLIY